MQRRRLLLLAPLGVTVLGGAAFFAVLGRMQTGHFDPHEVPSQIIDKPVPPFRLVGLSNTDLAAGHPVLVNFFASWCAACIDEAPVLMDLKRAGVPLIGIAYKDKPADTAAFLARYGNPFVRLAADPLGGVAIDWGLYGVPETYMIDAQGIVRRRYVGPLTPDAVTADVMPLLRHYA